MERIRTGVDTEYTFPHGHDMRDDLESSGSCILNMDTKEDHDRPHLLDAQLTHWLVRLPPLAVLVLARVSELRTESASVLFLASADPEKRRGELGTGGGEGIEGEKRGTPVIDTSDVEVVVAGGEGGTAEEWEEAEEDDKVVVGCAVGFKNCSRAFFAREKSELNPSLIAFVPVVLASSGLVEETRNGLGGTTASAGMPALSLSLCFCFSLAVRPSRSSQGPAVGTALNVSTPQSSAFCPGGSATTNRPRFTRPVSCSCVSCATGIGNCQLAPTDMHATGVRW